MTVADDKGIDETVGKQLKIIQYIERHSISELQGDGISQMIVALSTNNVFLGQFVAERDYEINMMEATRKNLWTDEYAQARAGAKTNPEAPVKTTQKDSEMMADKAVNEMVMDEIEAKRSLAKIKNLRIDCKELVSSLQSRLNHLKQERIDASMVPDPK
jgi:hypothetical protein